MWPFRRRPRDHGSHTAPPAAPQAQSQPQAWRSVPPIQRLTSDLQPVTQPRHFGSSLTSWQSPGLLEPLGHYVTDDGPVGVIDVEVGHAAPPSPPSGLEVPVTPHVQRFAPRPDGPTASVISPAADAVSEPALTAPPIVQPAVQALQRTAASSDVAAFESSLAERAKPTASLAHSPRPSFDLPE